jgi:cell division transport system permease protein
MKHWASTHRRALAEALHRFTAAPFASLLNVAVIGIALALPMAFYVLLDNARQLAREHAPQPELSLFLAGEAGAADIRLIEQRLKKHGGLAAYRFVSKAQALEQLKSRAGLGDVAAGLPQNPLPDAFVVTARDSSSSGLEALRAEFATWPKVAEAHVDSDWARRLDNLIALGHRAVVMLAGVLAFALAAVTFNTIRLQILTQREEIEVAKLIGATDGWIQRPFLYYGALAGAAGGITAWVLTVAALMVFNSQLQPLAALYGLPLQLKHMNWGDSLYALVIAAGLGWFGAWLSVRRHLSHHNPS